MENKKLLKNLKDPKFYLENFTKIKGKKPGALIPFVLNEAQKDLFNTVRKNDRVIILKSRQIGFCFHPKTKILKSDLSWVEIDKIRVGDEIIATDEIVFGGRGSSRKMRTAVVQDKRDINEEALKLTMDDGRVLELTADHRMLCRARGAVHTEWRKAKNIRLDDEIRYITKLWKYNPSYEDGWISGILDGEGSVGIKRTGVDIAISQIDGFVWDRILKYFGDNNYLYRVEIDKRVAGSSSKLGSKPVNKLVISRMDEIFRLLGTVRPSRFCRKFWWEGKKFPRNGWSRVVRIELLPKQRMIDLQTSTKTFIANGFVSHNSTAMIGYFYHNTITTPGTTTAIIGYNADLTSELFDKVKTFYRSTPSSLRPTIQYNSRYEISFPRLDSKILVLPSTVNVGRGYTLNNVLCLSGNTEVFTKNGIVKKIKNIKNGDFVVNGKGGLSKVKKVIKQKKDEKLLKISVVGSNSLKLTKDHEILCRGSKKNGYVAEWKRADKIIKNKDYIAFPLNQISKINYVHLLKKGKFYYWAKIKKVEETENEEFVYDIVLEKNPHSFLTTSGVVHNCTELSAWDNQEEKMMTLEASVPIHGKMVIESTPRGVGNLYHRMWVSDNNDYVKKEYGWHWGYSKEEVEIIRRRMNNPTRFAQEFELEFLSSGRPVFDPYMMKEMRKNIWRLDEEHEQDGVIYKVKEVDHLRIYKEPVADGIYSIGVDVSEGVEGGDYSVATVWNRKTGEEVAMFRGLIPPDRFADKLYDWGMKYNKALMVVEINNHGLTTLTCLKQKMYPSLYFRPKKIDSLGVSSSDKFGWKTTKVTRPLLIDEFAQACREGEMIIHSKELLDEMTVFVYNDSGNMVPQSRSYNDDCIFSAGIAWQGFKLMPKTKLVQLDYQNYLPTSFSY